MFKVDFIDGKAVEWIKTADGVIRKENADYRPRFYVECDDLFDVRLEADSLPSVEATKVERKYTSLKDKEKKRVLRIDTEPNKLKDVVYGLKNRFLRFELRFYNADFQPQHRYCIQEGKCPRPKNGLEILELELEKRHLSDEKLGNLIINGESFRKHSHAVEELNRCLKHQNPDILKVNRGQLLPIISRYVDISRKGGIEKVAGGNTVSSYGKTVNKPSRFNVPGRVIIDESNSFLLEDAGIQGMWDLVERSYKPLQEVAWASIGNVLTSIEARKAMEKDILTPWKNWSGEEPKKASDLHAADRGGFIFSPEPGIYEEVHECDFSSMYPNIMIEKNISPETVLCDCCDNGRVPELEWNICEKREGFIPETLWKLVADRQRWKDSLSYQKDKELLQSKIDAVKWLLVSCYGYMGHAHASYGAIKCHQAINAYAREILREAKEVFESNGWKVDHGIIDSIWVEEDSNPVDVRQVCDRVTSKSGVELEHERKFEWCAFVPRQSDKANIGALNRYFGVSDGEVVAAGIETEQRSTPEFVRQKQFEMIEALDRDMEPFAVVKIFQEGKEQLKRGNVELDDLVVTKKITKELEDYSVENRSTAAIRRARLNGFEVRPGEEVSYVVKDNSSAPSDRVRLDFEAKSYDTGFYIDLLRRAADTVLAPMDAEVSALTDKQHSVEKYVEM